MQSKTSLALLFGLGIRLLVDRLSGLDHVGIIDTVLVGIWQGIALYYALADFPPLVPFAVCLAIGENKYEPHFKVTNGTQL